MRLEQLKALEKEMREEIKTTVQLSFYLKTHPSLLKVLEILFLFC